MKKESKASQSDSGQPKGYTHPTDEWPFKVNTNTGAAKKPVEFEPIRLSKPIPEGWKKVCVASLGAPDKDDFQKVINIIRSDEEPGKFELKGLTLCEGPGCYNWGLLLAGNDIENWANQFSKAIGPAQWSYTHDADPMVEEGKFLDLRTFGE